MKYSFIFLITLIFSCNIINDKSINQINSDDLVEFIQINDAILVDVRTEDEYNTGYIENSINIDYLSDIFDYNIEKLDKNTPIILYCRSGNRSNLSAEKLSKKGFREIYNLKGGILDWIELGNNIVFTDTIN